MYFIKYHPLKEQLRERTFTDRDGLPYYILFIAFTTFMVGFSAESSDSIDAISAGLSATIAILGTIYSYKKNGGRTGYDYIQKAIVLGWVVVFRCLLLFVFLTMIVGYLAKTALGIPLEAKSWIDVVLSQALTVIYYQRLGRHIEDTNRSDGEQRDTPDAARDAAQVIPLKR